MNQLSNAKRTAVVAALVEGNSVRATARMTGVSKPTILKLLVDLGAACAKFSEETSRNLKTKRVQCDELWAFVGAKQKNVPAEKRGQFGIGDVWTWTAIDADGKLLVSWFVGARRRCRSRLHARRRRPASESRTTHHRRPLGLSGAVEDAFGTDIDYAMLQKLYGSSSEAEHRYSPAQCIGCRVQPVTGDPNPKHISTS